MLAERVEQIAAAGGASDALNSLEHRISALADALEQRSRSGDTVPPMLEALVHSLSDKIEMIQQTRGGDNVAFDHLEDRIVKLVERLDASDSRLGHLEAIERGLADLLVHMQDMSANKLAGGLRAENSTGVVELKHDIARTHDVLDALRGTLGHVVDRLGAIEKDIRGEGRTRQAVEAEDGDFRMPVGKVAARVIAETPPPAPVARPTVQSYTQAQTQALAQAAQALAQTVAAQPQQAAPPPAKRLPPAGRMPLNPDLPPDQPLEPGSGPPPLRANPAARIAASEAALGGAGPHAMDAAGGKSGFIAAARRAAKAAVETAPSQRAVRVEPAELTEIDQIDGNEHPSLRGKLVKRVKSLFIAASIVAVVVGSIHIAGNVIDFGGSSSPEIKSANAPDAKADATDTAEATTAPPSTTNAPTSLIASPLKPAKLPGLMPPAANIAAIAPPATSRPIQEYPSLLSPPALNMPAQAPKNDVTGSIARPNTRATSQTSAVQPSRQSSGQLPAAIGGPRLRSAAAAGDAAAAYEVAVRFAEGRGVPANLEEAALWYERASSKGLAPAQFRFASMLEKGQGVKKDLAHARRLYIAAAGNGNAKAMHNLAVLYAEGIEGKPDYGTAAQWFRKASLRGIADSQFNLGVLAARGLGTEKNLLDAYKWFALAANQGDREAAKKRDEIAAHLDSTTLAAAQHDIKGFVIEPQPPEATVVPEPPGGWDHATPQSKQRPGKPLSLGAFEVGKR
jgi:localization factor PodJL